MPLLHSRTRRATIPPALAVGVSGSVSGEEQSAQGNVSSPGAREAPPASRWLIATFIAAAIAGIFVMVRPPTLLEEIGWQKRDVLGSFAQALGFFLAAVVISIAFASVAGGIAVLCGVRFRKALSVGYCICVVGLSSVALCGAVVGRVQYAPLVADKSVGPSYLYPAPPSLSSIPPAGPSPSRSSSRQDEAKAAKEMLAGLRSDIQSVSKGLTDANGVPQPITERFPMPATPPKNDFERMRSLVQDFLNDAASLRNDYMAALKEAGLPTLLDSKRMAADESFRDTYAILGRIKEVVNQYKGRFDVLLASMPKKMEEFGFRRSMQRPLLDSYQEGLDFAMPLLHESWDLEVASLDLMTELVGHLAATRDYWTPSDSGYRFSVATHRQKFYDIIDKIQAGVERQNEIRQQCLKHATKGLGGLEEEVPEIPPPSSTARRPATK